MDCSLPGSSIHGISIPSKNMKWIAISFSRRSGLQVGRRFTVGATREVQGRQRTRSQSEGCWAEQELGGAEEEKGLGDVIGPQANE